MIVKETRAADNKKAVIFCCDKNVIRYALFIVSQIKEAEPNHNFDICVATFDESLLGNELMPREIRTCLIEETKFLNFSTDRRIPSTAYIKLALPEIFAADYEQIIYLDADVFLRKGKISDLFDDAPLGTAVAGVVDSIQWSAKKNPGRAKYWEKLGITDKKYMNTGVLVFDVAKCNEINLTDGALEKSAEVFRLQISNPDLMFFHDQSAINAFLKGDWRSLPLKWNWQTLATTAPYIDDFEPNILHFIAETKPWLTYPVSYTTDYYAPYHNFFVEVLHEAPPSYAHAGFQEVSPPRFFDLLRNVLSPRKILRSINKSNPFRYTPLRGLLTKYRRKQQLKKLSTAIDNGGPVWPPKALDDWAKGR